MVILMELTNCTPNSEEPEFFEGTNEFLVTSKSGNIDVQNTNISLTGYRSSQVSFNDSDYEIEFIKPILRNNLNGKPYHICLEIRFTRKVDSTDVEQITVKYFADFERPLRYNENYRMPVTLVLHEDATFIENNASGQVGFKFDTSSGPIVNEYELEINTHLEIKVGPETQEGSIQEINLIGDFLVKKDNNNNIIVGNLNTKIEGKNLVDLSFF